MCDDPLATVVGATKPRRSGMSDEAAITTLVHSYARLLDGGEVDAVVALFEHSTWRSEPGGSVRHGPAEIRPVYEQLLGQDRTSRSKHLLTNLSIEVGSGADTARSHCYWTVLHSGDGGRVEVSLSGQYADTFEKVDGGWRFTDRLITVDLTAEPAPGASG
jgi:hypothetical protein